MSARFSAFGAALENVANEIVRVGEALGPVVLVVDNQGDNDVILTVSKLSDESHVSLADDTAVSGGAFSPAYTGNASTLDFTGSKVGYYPVIPGTVTVTPTAGGNSVDATDEDQDGNLYATISTVKTLVGTINYITGEVDLHYPSGSDPNTGAITASYEYTAAAGKPLCKMVKNISNLPPAETYVIKALSKKGYGSCPVRIEAFLPF